MSANETQIGGKHYKGREYQHWDFVNDANIPYLIGCATKYVSRWQDKNGCEDLKKAIHYLQKADELHVRPKKTWRSDERDNAPAAWERFVSQHNSAEKDILMFIRMGHYVSAVLMIQDIIKKETPVLILREDQRVVP